LVGARKGKNVDKRRTLEANHGVHWPYYGTYETTRKAENSLWNARTVHSGQWKSFWILITVI
jgi:hypothetical protein